MINMKRKGVARGTEFAFFVVAILIAAAAFMFFTNLQAAQTTQLLDLDRETFMASQELRTFSQTPLQGEGALLVSSNPVNVLADLDSQMTVLDAANEYFSTTNANYKIQLKEALTETTEKFFENRPDASIKIIKKQKDVQIGQKTLQLTSLVKNEVLVEIELPYFNSVAGENLWFVYAK